MTVMILLSMWNKILLFTFKLHLIHFPCSDFPVAPHLIHSLHGKCFSTPHSAFIVLGLEHWAVSQSSEWNPCLSISTFHSIIKMTTWPELSGIALSYLPSLLVCNNYSLNCKIPSSVLVISIFSEPTVSIDYFCAIHWEGNLCRSSHFLWQWFYLPNAHRSV